MNNKNNYIVDIDNIKKNFIKKCKLKDKKLCEFYSNIFINKILYKCIYPDNIEKELNKLIF